jgi:hypothetical protein
METASSHQNPNDSDDDANAAGHGWLDERLVNRRRPRMDTPKAIELVESQPASLQVAILKACVERLPALRAQWSDRDTYACGEQLYMIASRLYGKDLPLGNRDICDILCLSKHGCGHGTDVAAPVNLAVAFMSNNDVSSSLLLALATYVDGLKGVGSVQAQNVKRRASILYLLDRDDVLQHNRKLVWSRQFTNDLVGMDDNERRAWQSLVLSFKLNDRSELPNTWRQVAQSFAGQLGASKMVSRIAGWWPEKNAVCRLDAGASHLLKHFIWLLEAVDDVSVHKPTCHELVCSLSTVEWKPKQPAANVVSSAAHYLVKLPTELAWDPLKNLCSVASSRKEKVDHLVGQYAASHGLDFHMPDRAQDGNQSPPPLPERPWWKLW